MTEPSSVLLVHGLILSHLSMVPMGARLARLGWQTSYFAYSSLLEPTERVQRRLAQTLAQGRVCIVAHSLGGLMALETLCKHPGLPVERVVCLGSPLRGSGAAKGLHRYPLVARCAGRSDSILCRGLASLPTGPEVGMLAGRSPMGLGAFFGGLHGEHDGTVGVEETRIPGLADHQVVDASHTGMLLDADVASQVDHFLRTGRFA